MFGEFVLQSGAHVSAMQRHLFRGLRVAQQGGDARPDFPSYHSRAASDGSKGLAVATVISTTGWVAAMAPMTLM